MERVMRTPVRDLVLLIAWLLPCIASADDGIVRRGGETFPIASSVRVPAGAETLWLSGLLPDVVDADAPAGSAERFGDTEAQTRSVIAKIRAELEAAGWSLGDVVKMNVYLVADPAQGGRMDFAGMMRAYREAFGSAAQPKLPARTTVEVRALPVPGALVEIEVVAARVPKGEPDPAPASGE
jgi:enamine deaminase RidA (YjgF/YER057c/UK114 family)